jgi:CHAD domain-containing protein
MDTATETERKYDVPDGFELPWLTEVRGVTALAEAQTHELDATYFDTDELLLARSRRTLRRRTGGSDAGWHLKTPGGGSSRTEHRLPLDADQGNEAEVPEALRAEVRAIVRDHPLRPVTRLRTRRVETPLCDEAGRTLALLAQDEVTAETDGVQQRWTELEVELVDGDAKLLKAVEKRLRKAGATPAAGPSKLARALGDRLTTGTHRAVTGGKLAPVIDYVRTQRDTIVAHDPAVRHGEAEAIHKMRVATRRLRSTLKTFRELWDREQVQSLRAELKWLAERLGGVRDPQVQTGRLGAAADDNDTDLTGIGARLRSHLGEQLEQGRAELGTALDDARYLRLLDALDALVDTAPEPVGARRIRSRARKALAAADQLLEEADRSPADRDHHLHEARKAYKRARYAVEVFVPSVGEPAKQLAASLTELQDVLGVHQDSVVARELLRELAGRAHQDGENGFGYGVLYARQQAAGEAVLEQLPRVRQQAGRRKLRSWM